MSKHTIKSVVKSKKAQWGFAAAIWLSMPFSVPALAQVVERVAFSAPPRAIQVALPTEPGISRFIVASNAPFHVTSSGILGDVSVKVFISGTVNGNLYGAKAQAPGDISSCAALSNKDMSLVYAANQKTAREPGDILEQSVMIEVRYPKFTSPDIQIIAGKAPSKLPVQPVCDPTEV